MTTPRKTATAAKATGDTTAPAAEKAARRRTLAPLPEGWDYEVSIVRTQEDEGPSDPTAPKDRIRILPASEKPIQNIEITLAGRRSTMSADDLPGALEKSKAVLKQYVAYREQTLAFETTIGGLPVDRDSLIVGDDAVVGRAHVDADSATTAMAPPVPVESASGPTLAEAEAAAGQPVLG